MPLSPGFLTSVEVDNADEANKSAALSVIHHPTSSPIRGRGRGRGSPARGGGRSTPTREKDSRNCVICHKSGYLEDKCWKKNGKPDWAIKPDPVATSSPSNSLAIECQLPSIDSRVTLSHANFERLLKLAHGDQPPFTDALARSGSSSPLLHSPWLIDSGATDHMTCSHLHFAA